MYDATVGPQNIPIPTDYVERVYAGVLGKIIGVYLGRPFEGWSHQAIVEQLGEINYYVHEKRNVPLIVSDDDISGTFTFIRALEDYGFEGNLAAAQIGQTWLNYIIENKTVLWWGGMGMSTEHTAFLRLKSGVPAPQSGSLNLNGKVVSEQIGSQIFIDGWAMVAPGDPHLAAELAGKAASVSHDGEAIYGAQVIAAMEAMAFVEKDLGKLIDGAVRFIPKDSVIYRMIEDMRRCRERTTDWHAGLAMIHEKYNYEIFGGGCHIVPNHAIIMLGLLWGNDDFQRSLMITNTAGYDTDCNSGNVGCLMGIKNGLAGIDSGPDWRGPVADRLLLSTADGGRCITDAVGETYALVNTHGALVGKKPQRPKNGARFNFELPGSVQGFMPENSSALTIENVAGHSREGTRSLALRFRELPGGRFGRVSTQTFISTEQTKASPYAILASPTLYPGQVVDAEVSADARNGRTIDCGLFIRHFDGDDRLVRLQGPLLSLKPGERRQLIWRIPQIDGQPIAEIGVEISCDQPASGSVYLDYLTWHGSPDVILKKPDAAGTMWIKAWVDGMQQRLAWDPEIWIQNEGRGLIIQGTRDWIDYKVTTEIRPHMVKAAGLAARVQGMQRYYALLASNDGIARLIKMLDEQTILAQMDFKWNLPGSYEFSLEVEGNHITAWIDGQMLFQAMDADRPLTSGAIGIVCEEGRGRNGPVKIEPIRAKPL